MGASNARKVASRPTAPKTSYWVGASREELSSAIQARRWQQQTATVSDLTHDPIVEATAELLKRRQQARRETRV